MRFKLSCAQIGFEAEAKKKIGAKKAKEFIGQPCRHSL